MSVPANLCKATAAVAALVCFFGRPGAAAPPIVPAEVVPAPPAEVSPDQVVADVRVLGNKQVPLAKIAPHIRTRPGRAFDNELIEQDVRRLTQTKMFVNVKTFSRRTETGIIVVFEVLERPILHYVKYIGNESIADTTLRKQAEVRAGDPLDPFAVEEGRRKIEAYYHEKGFSRARVTLIEGNKVDDRGAVFLINEGQKQRILWTQFVGNTIASDGRLRTQVESKPGILWFFKGEVDRKKIDEDINRLTAYYRGLGFFNAQVGRELQFNEGQNWLTLTFIINEGPRYKIRSVQIVGNSKFTAAELAEKHKLLAGQYFNQGQMQADVISMQDKYGSIGHVFADVKADPRFLEEPGQLDLVYNVAEGDRYRVGKINIAIKGEYPRTRITTVLNRLSIRPGDVVDTRELRSSERRLQACGLFRVDAANGVKPKIVFSPPELEGEEGKKESGIARRPGTKPGVRGQSPDAGSDADYWSQAAEGFRQDDAILNLTLEAEVEPTAAWPDEPVAAPPPVELQPAPPAQPPAEVVIRGQSPDAVYRQPMWRSAGQPPAEPAVYAATPVNYAAAGMAPQPGGVAAPYTPGPIVPVQYAAPSPNVDPAAAALPPPPAPPAAGFAHAAPSPAPAPAVTADGQPMVFPDANVFSHPREEEYTRPLTLDVDASETETGRLMVGVGVNSDAGLLGQIIIDERNFDWTRVPRSFEDIRNGTAWRGAGQGFRIEAVPGTQLQRYLINFREPYLFDTDVSLSLGGYYHQRRYREWDEDRVGGRIGLGYQFNHDLSGTFTFRGESVTISNPAVGSNGLTPDPINDALGQAGLYGFGVSLSHDTRDSSFLATEGHLLELTFEQVIGTYVYPRAEIDLRRYFTLYQRPDGSGRHVLSMVGRFAVTGNDTPVYEHYFAGGFSTLRGFRFRGASPRQYDVAIGGEAMMLASLEYMFPITADDMLRGVVFCDTGTVLSSIDDWSERYRVSPGFGMRISIPALGPAPIALDFAFPVSDEEGDRREMFSFFIGINR